MFDIGWSELVVVGIVALIVIGPKELPATLRTVGQAMGKLRRMAAEFQGQFQDAMREAELDELRKQAEKLSRDATSAASFDPVGQVKTELQDMIDAPSKPASSVQAPTSGNEPAVESPASGNGAPETPKDPPSEPAPDSAPGGGRSA